MIVASPAQGSTSACSKMASRRLFSICHGFGYVGSKVGFYLIRAEIEQPSRARGKIFRRVRSSILWWGVGMFGNECSLVMWAHVQDRVANEVMPMRVN